MNHTATEIKVEANFDSSGSQAESFVKIVREVLKSGSSEEYSFYLHGGSSGMVDTVTSIYFYFPTMIGVTIGCVYIIVCCNPVSLFLYNLCLFFFFFEVAIWFRSAFSPLRCVFTIALTISWVYALSVAVFQFGWLNWLDSSLKISDGIYWMDPIVTFPIIVGLALDYDIFLMSRIVEYKKLGYSDPGAILHGMEKTGCVNPIW
jgi:hypothetical protein